MRRAVPARSPAWCGEPLASWWAAHPQFHRESPPVVDPTPRFSDAENRYAIDRRVTACQHTITGTKSGMQEMPPQEPPRTRRGRKPKGVRVGTFVSLPVELRRAAEEIARREQLPLGDVITRIVAEGLGIPAPAYCYPTATQQSELPLTKAS